MENIQAESIDNLQITGNDSLSSCAILSICNYLADPNGEVWIEDNACGCNSPEEVQEACDTVILVEEVIGEGLMVITPNPCSEVVTIGFTIDVCRLVIVDLVDMTGIRVKRIIEEQKLPGTYNVNVDLSELPKGVYYCILKNN